jgi:hypothetical protein
MPLPRALVGGGGRGADNAWQETALESDCAEESLQLSHCGWLREELYGGCLVFQGTGVCPQNRVAQEFQLQLAKCTLLDVQ